MLVRLVGICNSSVTAATAEGLIDSDEHRFLLVISPRFQAQLGCAPRLKASAEGVGPMARRLM
jgi:hypothetical protein